MQALSSDDSGYCLPGTKPTPHALHRSPQALLLCAPRSRDLRFQMRRLHHKETRALSCDDWGLFVRARSHVGPHEVNESVHWRDTGASANSRGWGGPGSQQEPGLVPALQATCTRVLFLFLSGLEPNKPGHPGGRDRAPPPKTLTRAAFLGLTKIPYPSCQTGPERVWLTL